MIGRAANIFTLIWNILNALCKFDIYCIWVIMMKFQRIRDLREDRDLTQTAISRL